MDYEVELPDLGPEGGDHATVSEWNFEEGEFVEHGEVLLEVICDAGAIDVVAPRPGILLERTVDEDDIVRIGETVAILDVKEGDEPPTEPIEEEPVVDLVVFEEDDDDEEEVE
jgi:2-oxoglutarate dehydrogenase E2 component (dihydrolipoamide succinyltransferase)